MRLTESTFLALGEGARVALKILPGPAFRLYVHLCFLANRETGRAEVRYGDIAKELRRCKRSVESDFDLLEKNQICVLDTAANQHKLVQVEIADRFWVYKKPQNLTASAPQTEDHDSAPEITAQEVNVASAPTSLQISQGALNALLSYGIAPAEARALAQSCDAESIIDGIDYVMHLVSIRGNNIRNPQSLLIHRLRNGVQIARFRDVKRNGTASIREAEA